MLTKIDFDNAVMLMTKRGFSREGAIPTRPLYGDGRREALLMPSRGCIRFFRDKNSSAYVTLYNARDLRRELGIFP